MSFKVPRKFDWINCWTWTQRSLFLQELKSSNCQQLEQQGRELVMEPVRPLQDAFFALQLEAGKQFAEACSAATSATRGSRPGPCRFECPLTLDLMRSPVTAEGDGYTCERMITQEISCDARVTAIWHQYSKTESIAVAAGIMSEGQPICQSLTANQTFSLSSFRLTLK